ncbi:MAG: DNA-directed RNA polymerase subunit omega [Candidatus Brocadiaceae bacterium]|nr:DNA-directed RNA polymerase subunit omega [Candidatus Brocadiaceae bacterium]
MNYKKLDEFAKQTGGPLRLTSLIISRARQLAKISKPLIDTKIDDPVEIAFMELTQNKIKLHEAGEDASQSESGKVLEITGGQ